MATRVIKWNETANLKNFSLDDWIAWHRGLVQEFGNEKVVKKDGTKASFTKADYIFVMSWIGAGMPTSLTMQALIAAPSHFKEQLDYFKKYPTLYDNLQFKNIVEIGKYNPVNIVAKTVETAVGVASDVTDAIAGVGKILRVAIPLALVATLVFGGIWSYNKFVKN